MDLFRLTLTRHAADLSGAGARLYGGRWNERDVPVLYTAENRALAVLEYLANLPLTVARLDMSIVTVEVPDTVPLETLAVSSLPPHWRSSVPWRQW